MSEHSEEYEKYLQGEHWVKLRSELFQKTGRVCKACGSNKQIQAHHLIYREPLESCTVEDLMPLCDCCHTLLHKIPYIIASTKVRKTPQDRVLFVREQLWKAYRRGSNPSKKKKNRLKQERRRLKRLKKLFKNPPARGYRQPTKWMDYGTYKQALRPDLSPLEKMIQGMFVPKIRRQRPTGTRGLPPEMKKAP